MGTDTAIRERRNSSPCPPDVLARFRQMLEDQRADLLRSCQGLSHVALRKSGDQGGDDSRVTEDPADLASEASAQDLSLNMLGRAQSELEEVARALKRIDDRSYGLCDECRQPIPAARLEAIPTAATCVACKTKSETRSTDTDE
jgi:DnaK suppressor protein